MTKKNPGGDNVVSMKERRCSICGQPTVDRWRPFCCKRCADIDLGRWLGESYRIASQEESGGEETPEADR